MSEKFNCMDRILNRNASLQCTLRIGEVSGKIVFTFAHDLKD